MDYLIHWQNFVPFFKSIIQALPITLLITFVCSIIGTVIGILSAIVRYEQVPVFNKIVLVFVSFFTGTPLYTQLLIAYFGVPYIVTELFNIQFDINALQAVYIAYSLNLGAYLCQTFLSGLNGVSSIQYDAAYASGMNKKQTYQNIIFPQAVQIAIPDYGVKIITLLKDTSIASAIGILDVTGQVEASAKFIGSYVEGYIAAALTYIFFSLLLSVIFDAISSQSAVLKARGVA